REGVRASPRARRDGQGRDCRRGGRRGRRGALPVRPGRATCSYDRRRRAAAAASRALPGRGPLPRRSFRGIASAFPGRCTFLSLLLRPTLPALVAEAVDRVGEGNEEQRVERRKPERSRDVVVPVLRAEDVEEREDHGAEDERATGGSLPRGRRRDPPCTTATLPLRLCPG